MLAIIIRAPSFPEAKEAAGVVSDAMVASGSRFRRAIAKRVDDQREITLQFDQTETAQ